MERPRQETKTVGGQVLTGCFGSVSSGHCDEAWPFHLDRFPARCGMSVWI